MEASDSKDTSHSVQSLSEGKYLDSRELSYRGVHGVLSVETCNVTCPMQKASKQQQFNSRGKEGNKKIVITAEATSKQAIEQHQS